VNVERRFASFLFFIIICSTILLCMCRCAQTN